ncbi:MAG: exonuclease domain-containing protein [Eubacterium sp.]|nr:exonuclease domain-containing protein [Eubacterium sp.]
MEYIIFDLEWNNAYNYKLKKGMNEILEIGALKLDDRLEIVDTFKQLIKPRLSKKLRSSFKNLTHITMDEIRRDGVDFDIAFNDFARWCGGGDVLFLSWSSSDLYTLVENFKKFKESADIPFIRKYADAQKYCMRFIDDADAGAQISLANCAAKFDIDVNTDNLHRALEDCYVTAYCIKKVFDEKLISDYIKNCNVEFFERLVFKNYYILTPDCDDFKLSDVKFNCEHCNKELKIMNNYELVNNTFRNTGKCPSCNKSYWLSVRAKRTYDNVIVTKKVIQISKKRARELKH